jgi:hypothetical protein
MSLTQISREHWKEFFDRASKAAAEQPTTVEVTGLGLGDRIAADRAPLRGVSYEPRDDTLTLFLEGLEHRIHRAKAIHAEQVDGELRSFEVVDADDNHHIVQLATPLAMRTG